MGKEFSGNIFLIDYGSWESNPIAGPRELDVTPAIEEHILQRTEELIDYINDPQRIPLRDKPDELENTFVKLVRDQLAGRLSSTLEGIGLNLENVETQRLVKAVEESVAQTSLTRQTLEASPTVSIHRQQALYDRLAASLRRRGINYIMPKHPRDGAAYQSYVAAIRRCHGAILKYPASDRSDRYFAQMALRWMRGDPLPRIIDDNQRYREQHGQSPSLAMTIRNTLSEIENDLRFKYVRLFACYNAVLELLLKNEALDEFIPSIPAIPMYLEVGASSPTMISFMGIGLSRFTSGKLSVLARRQDMAQNDAREWISRQEIDSFDLPRASIREIRRVVFRV